MKPNTFTIVFELTSYWPNSCKVLILPVCKTLVIIRDKQFLRSMETHVFGNSSNRNRLKEY